VAAIILSAATVIADANVHNLDDLLALGLSRALALEPELVLMGTGARQIFPAPSVGAQFLTRRHRVRVMDTSAACRTFNVLVGEQKTRGGNIAALKKTKKIAGR